MHSSFFPGLNQAAWLYTAYELGHASVFPVRTMSRRLQRALGDPAHPLSMLPNASYLQASWRIVDEVTRRYGKPEFGLDTITVNGESIDIVEDVVMSKPFCELVHFRREGGARNLPKVLIVAPMSGHFATLVRGTVRAMLDEHDVYVTDWRDARTVPLVNGSFDLDDYVDYLSAFFRHLGPDLHVVAVCQPAVPALAATALLAEDDDPAQPRSLTLMGGPIDAAANPTKVNEYATTHELDWFKARTITYVPFPHLGALRAVYPGFMQLAGFMGMNVDNHLQAYRRYFDTLVVGDADSVAQHRRFYDEYLAVMDLPAEYFLQTLERVFINRDLANGQFRHRGRLVRCEAIKKTALMTVEGERDDICGLGQTEAAHKLCTDVPQAERYHYVQPGVGHYGVFNGTRWRTEIQPRVKQMIAATG